MTKKEVITFWSEGASPKMNYTGMLQFLQAQGISRARTDSQQRQTILIKETDRKIKEVTIEDLSKLLKEHILLHNPDFYESFLRGASSHLANYRLLYLDETLLEPTRDGANEVKFFFKNCFIKVTPESIESLEYSKLKGSIWEDSIINDDFILPKEDIRGQFEEFCYLISKKNKERFLSLQTILGYLIHKNKSRGENKAVIFYDEKMNEGSGANGRTGKTLITQALSKVRKTVFFNGKELKSGQWFKNQRITLSTDLVIYDDLAKNTSFEQFFSSVTSGIEIERKNKDSFFISHENAPKYIITSNTYVKGPGGSSDRARRCEFELANIFSDTFTPENHFNNRFFDDQWSREENNKFYQFLMKCAQLYLKLGLVMAPSLNLKDSKLKSEIPAAFRLFLTTLRLQKGLKLNRNELLDKFIKSYPTYKDMSSQQFRKWTQKYCERYNINVSFTYSNSTSWMTTKHYI